MYSRRNFQQGIDEVQTAWQNIFLHLSEEFFYTHLACIDLDDTGDHYADEHEYDPYNANGSAKFSKILAAAGDHQPDYKNDDPNNDKCHIVWSFLVLAAMI